MTKVISIPELQTERLRLRAPGPEDSVPFIAFYGSERSAMVGGPVDAREAWYFLGSVIGHWGLRGFGRWMVLDQSSNATCGMVGLHYPLHWPEPELGWVLFDGFEGRGIATEAARAARQFAYETVGLTTLISMIDPENSASIAVARRLGAIQDGTFDNHGQLRQVWRHPAPSALAREDRGAA